jgi:transitional endoplasmic reticulum ATPase
VQAADLQGIEVRPEDVRTARRAVQPSATREVFTEIPDVRWSDIGGLEEAKACLAEAVEWPLAHPDLFDRAGVEPPRGVLLAGPPGCGKTLLAQAVATETNANFISIKGPALLSKYVGTSEKRVRDIFRKAREAAPCIIFFDEIDALASTRAGIDTDSGVAARVLTQVLTEMDGAEALEDVVVLGATNRIDRIDEALLRPGRFDEIVRIERPGPDERAAILKVHLRDKPVASDVEAEPLVPATEGFSGADIAAACRRAAMQAMRRVVRASSDEGPPADVLEITRADLDRAIEEVGRRQAGTNPPGVNGDPSS